MSQFISNNFYFMKKHELRFYNSLIISKPNNQQRSPFKRQRQKSNQPNLSHEKRISFQNNSELLASEVKQKLQSLIAQMLERVQEIVTKEKSNLKLAMNYVRSSIIFKEIDQIDSKVVDQIVGDYVKNRLEAMQEKLIVKSKQLQQLKQEIKYQQQFNEIRLKASSIHIPPHESSIIGTLYSKARTNSYQFFKELYTELHNNKSNQFLQSKVTNISHQYQQLKQANPKVNSQVNIKLPITQQEIKKFTDQLEPFMNTMPQETKYILLSILQTKVVCMSPCCRWDRSEEPIKSPFKSYMNRPPPNSNRSNSFYRTSDFQKFQSRYVTKNFKVDEVVSMIRTRTQQMDKYYSLFKRKHRNKMREQQRNKSIT